MKIKYLKGMEKAVLGALLLLAACDSTTDADRTALTVQGTVTDDAGYSKAQAAIEGAVVTATEVRSDGSTHTLDGQATTNAQGQFSLDLDERADVLVLTAEKASFRSKALVYAEAEQASTVQAMPMTNESRWEAEVYLAAKAQGAAEAPTTADVVYYVDAAVAADLAAGRSAVADIAASVRAADEAEEAFVHEKPKYRDDDPSPETRRKEEAAFAELQAALAVSANGSGASAAQAAFEQKLIAASAEAGLLVEDHAKARQAGRAALVRSTTETHLALRKRAEVLAALATASAVEARFEAEGASSARSEALAQAGATLIAELRAATSAQAMAAAKAAYQAEVESALDAELGLSALAMTGLKGTLATEQAVLEASLAGAASPEAVATAYSSFYASAETALAAGLEAAGSTNVGFGVQVLVLLSLL